MAITQTRFTYPMVGSKFITLDYRHGQKYHLADNGGLLLPTAGAKVNFFRYVGKRSGRFSIIDYDPNIRLWKDIEIDSSNLQEIMRSKGFEFVGQVLNASGLEAYTKLSFNNLATIGSGRKEFFVGSSLSYVKGMRIRATANINAPTLPFMDGYVENYEDGILTVYCDFFSGSGVYASWTISGLNAIYVRNTNWGSSLATNINPKTNLFNKPGLYADVWEIETDEGKVGPITNYFRLESNLQTPLYTEPRHWYDCQIWPSNIPFRSTDVSSPSIDMMVGITPVSKNPINPVAYKAFQTLVSTLYVELIEIWFYEHETEGPLDPPVKIDVGDALPLQFEEQIFNFFFGKVDPDWFQEPGEYRIKFRVRDTDSEPNMSEGQYHDFWKTVNVDRSVQSISNPISQCYRDATSIFGALSECTYVLGYGDANQNITALAKGSASDFLEPRDKETCYEKSQKNTLNTRMVSLIGSGSEIDLGTTISDHFTPLVITDGQQLNPSEPLNGSGIGAVIRDYTVENNKIKLTTPYTEFAQVVYGYKGDPYSFGKIEVIFGSQSKFSSLSNGNYVLKIPFLQYNYRFNILFLQNRADLSVRTVVPPDKFFIGISGNDAFLFINQVWFENFIDTFLGSRYYRFQLYASHSTNPDESPIQIRSHLSHMATGFTILPGKPKSLRLPEMIFWNGKPQFRHYDYIFFYSATSNSSTTIGLGPKLFSTQSSKAFYPGYKVIAYSQSGDFMRGVIIQYTGTNLIIQVEETWGNGNTHGFWFIYMEESDSSNINFFFNPNEGDPVFALYDAEV